MSKNLVQHWYSIPQKTIAACTAEGFKNIPTEIGLRAVTGDDINRSQEATSMKAVMGFRNRLMASSICGVNYDPARDKSQRKLVHNGVTDPNLLPQNLFAELPSKVISLINSAFSDINDGDTEEDEDFKKSRVDIA